MNGAVEESLVIGEHYVGADQLIEFMGAARGILRQSGVEDIYGTIRSIRRDTTTFLPWARDDYACVIFNLRTEHTATGIARTHETFRQLTDASLALSGGFYLTYHRAATARQVEAAYPRFRDFLRAKREHDPRSVFESEWYRHYSKAFDG